MDTSRIVVMRFACTRDEMQFRRNVERGFAKRGITLVVAPLHAKRIGVMLQKRDVETILGITLSIAQIFSNT